MKMPSHFQRSLLFRPSVPVLYCDAGVTGLAQAHQVRWVVCTTSREGYDVVDLLGRGVPACFEAHLAQRMLLEMAVTDLSPCTAVTVTGLRVALISVIVRVHLLLVFRAVGAIRQLTATGPAAGTLGLMRHGSLLSGKTKVTGDFSSMTFCILLC